MSDKYRIDRASVLTTGEVAKELHVSHRTVHKWIDNGTIKGWRIPGSKHRRVNREDLETFKRSLYEYPDANAGPDLQGQSEAPKSSEGGLSAVQRDGDGGV